MVRGDPLEDGLLLLNFLFLKIGLAVALPPQPVHSQDVLQRRPLSCHRTASRHGPGALELLINSAAFPIMLSCSSLHPPCRHPVLVWSRHQTGRRLKKGLAWGSRWLPFLMRSDLSRALVQCFSSRMPTPGQCIQEGIIISPFYRQRNSGPERRGHSSRLLSV